MPNGGRGNLNRCKKIKVTTSVLTGDLDRYSAQGGSRVTPNVSPGKIENDNGSALTYDVKSRRSTLSKEESNLTRCSIEM